MTITEQIDARLRQTLATDDSIVHKFYDAAGDLAVNLVMAAVILIATLWASRFLSRLTQRALARIPGRRAPDGTLQSFIASMVRYGILVVGLIAVLQQLGVQTTSIIAVLGAASLAVGLALRGALSNVAAGVMILLLRPYRVGDIIETGAFRGRVTALDLFTTELTSLDNLRVIAPNGKVFGDIIVNHTFHDERRVDATFRIPVTADLSAVMAGVMARAKADPRVAPEPAPTVEVTGMSEAWVDGVVRAWTRRQDHAAIHADLLLTARLIAAGKADEIPPPPAAEAEDTPPPRPQRRARKA